MNVQPTIEVINNMSKECIYRAQKLSDIALKMNQTSDLNYAAEALIEITNLIANLRLDLLVVRPLRETLK